LARFLCLYQLPNLVYFGKYLLLMRNVIKEAMKETERKLMFVSTTERTFPKGMQVVLKSVQDDVAAKCTLSDVDVSISSFRSYPTIYMDVTITVDEFTNLKGESIEIGQRGKKVYTDFITKIPGQLRNWIRKIAKKVSLDYQDINYFLERIEVNVDVQQQPNFDDSEDKRFKIVSKLSKHIQISDYTISRISPANSDTHDFFVYVKQNTPTLMPNWRFKGEAEDIRRSIDAAIKRYAGESYNYLVVFEGMDVIVT
jgi:hypothetical protein